GERPRTALVRGAKTGPGPAITPATGPRLANPAISPLASCPRPAPGSQLRPFPRSPRARDGPSARKSGHFTARLVPATGPRLANPAISPLASCPRRALGSQIRPFHRSPRARDGPSARKSGHFTARLVPATGPRLANPAISPLASCPRRALGSQIHHPNGLALGPLDL